MVQPCLVPILGLAFAAKVMHEDSTLQYKALVAQLCFMNAYHLCTQLLNGSYPLLVVQLAPCTLPPLHLCLCIAWLTIRSSFGHSITLLIIAPWRVKAACMIMHAA